MEEIGFEEANKIAKQIFPGTIESGEIRDIFYDNHQMVIHTTTGHRLTVNKEKDIKRLMTACAVVLNKVESLKGI